MLAETREVFTATLGSVAGSELVDLGPQHAGVPGAEGPMAGTVQLWPHRHRTDAMFMALLRRG